MRHLIMTIIAVILILFILLGVVLTIYTWYHFKQEQSAPDDNSVTFTVNEEGAVSVLALPDGGLIARLDYARLLG